MKKNLRVLVAVAGVLGLAAGCSGTSDEPPASTSEDVGLFVDVFHPVADELQVTLYEDDGLMFDEDSRTVCGEVILPDELTPYGSGRRPVAAVFSSEDGKYRSESRVIFTEDGTMSAQVACRSRDEDPEGMALVELHDLIYDSAASLAIVSVDTANLLSPRWLEGGRGD